jgi:hypothetical protein
MIGPRRFAGFYGNDFDSNISFSNVSVNQNGDRRTVAVNSSVLSGITTDKLPISIFPEIDVSLDWSLTLVLNVKLPWQSIGGTDYILSSLTELIIYPIQNSILTFTLSSSALISSGFANASVTFKNILLNKQFSFTMSLFNSELG